MKRCPRSSYEDDKLFAEQKGRIDDFSFGAQTAAVFDDMLNRSVPYYGEIQRMVGEMVADFATPNSAIYDLGCSTGNTFLALRDQLPREMPIHLVGLDSSQEMLEKARSKLAEEMGGWNYELGTADLDGGVCINNASIVLMILTLQFIRPLHRESLLKDIYLGLNTNGCLILVEKILGDNSTFNRLFIKYYYEYKKREGYSEMEISQKREALENVLIPYRLEENKQLLSHVGFQQVDVFFKWYNFCGIIAVKATA